MTSSPRSRSSEESSHGYGPLSVVAGGLARCSLWPASGPLITDGVSFTVVFLPRLVASTRLVTLGHTGGNGRRRPGQRTVGTPPQSRAAARCQLSVGRSTGGRLSGDRDHVSERRRSLGQPAESRKLPVSLLQLPCQPDPPCIAVVTGGLKRSQFGAQSSAFALEFLRVHGDPSSRSAHRTR